MSILDFVKLKNRKAKTEPTEILKEKADKTSHINNMKSNSNTIRLIYVAMEPFNRYGTSNKMLGTTLNISSPFTLPSGMNIDEACKIISYLSEMVESQKDIEPASNNSVAFVSEKLEEYGFTKLPATRGEYGYSHTISRYYNTRRIFNIAKSGVLDLFTVGGDFDEFKNSDLHDRYFNWFTESVKQQEIRYIYERLDILVDELAQDENQMTIDEMQ